MGSSRRVFSPQVAESCVSSHIIVRIEVHLALSRGEGSVSKGGRCANSAIDLSGDSVVIQIDIKAPPEKHFTHSRIPGTCFYGGEKAFTGLLHFEMDARRGGHWSFRSRAVEVARNRAQKPTAGNQNLRRTERGGSRPARLLVWSWFASL